jgi:hypothetical protein
MVQEYGLSGTELPLPPNACRMRLVEGPLDISWHHCSLTSDFIGMFFSSRPGQDLSALEMRHSIGYLVNELLENAIKFRAPGDIEIEAGVSDATFALYLQNEVNAETAERFQAILSEIMDGDPGELLIERIEQNASDPESHASGLGLLTLMSDYGAQLGWKFSPARDPGIYKLETYAALEIS